MTSHFLPGSPPVALTLRHSPRARRVSLRVSGLDGRVTLSVPRGMSEADALDFAQSRAGWLRAQLARQPGCVQVAPGLDLPLEGRMMQVAPGEGPAVRIGADTIHVPGPEARIAARLEGWLKARARDRLAHASDRYAAELGRDYSRITLRDTRSRWGLVLVESGAQLFMAADHGTAGRAGLRRGPRGRASGRDEPFAGLLVGGQTPLAGS